jgi:pimeloyl-ACP methyl ester carboxylesterase
MADETAARRVDLTDLGFEASELASPVGRLRLYSAGAGPRLLLLHGIGGGASSYFWSALGPLLARQYAIVAADFVGWGDAEHPARFLLFDDYVCQIEALLDHAGPVEAVVAQSLAAGFALAALAGRPGAARRLVMLAPTGARDFGVDSFPWALRATLGVVARVPGANMALYRAYFHRRATIRSWLQRRGFLDGARVPEALVEAAFRSATQPNAAFSALPFVAGTLRYDIVPLLRALRLPALALWGADETQIKPEICRRLAAVAPEWVTQGIIPQSRADFELEQPHATADAILAFLRTS